MINNELESKKSILLLRLSIFIALLVFTPFCIVGMYKERHVYGICFFLAVFILLIPELFIKLFLRPISATLEKKHLIAKFYGSSKIINLENIAGYSRTEESDQYGTKYPGVMLYLINGKHIAFTEINIKNVSILREHLDRNNTPYYGFEKLGMWFFFKYKYDDFLKS